MGYRPFWLSPRQVVVLPVAASHKVYAQEVADLLWNQGLYAEADVSDFTLNKRIRNAELAQVRTIFVIRGSSIDALFQFNFIMVVGSTEMEQRSVNLRNRDDIGKKGRDETMELAQAVQKMVALKVTRSLENKLI